jgi:hypothetical protein
VIFDEANHVYPSNAAGPAVSGRINGNRRLSRYGKELRCVTEERYISQPAHRSPIGGRRLGFDVTTVLINAIAS